MRLETRQLIQVLCSDLWEGVPWETRRVGAEHPPKTSQGARLWSALPQLACWLWHPLHCLGGNCSSGPGSGCWPAALEGRHPLLQETLSSPASLVFMISPISHGGAHSIHLFCQTSLLFQCSGVCRGGNSCLPSELGSLPVLEPRDDSKAENAKFFPALCSHWDKDALSHLP